MTYTQLSDSKVSSISYEPHLPRIERITPCRPGELHLRHRKVDGRMRRAGEVGSEGCGGAGERDQGRKAAEGGLIGIFSLKL